jgi:small subunit ribosomal protein S16
MPVAIRLSRIGKKSEPYYRMVILDSRKKRDGACLENIGTINGLTGEFITFKPERFDAWVALGAQPSDTAKKLYRQYKNQKKETATVAKTTEKAPKAVKAKARVSEEQKPEDTTTKSA